MNASGIEIRIGEPCSVLYFPLKWKKNQVDPEWMFPLWGERELVHRLRKIKESEPFQKKKKIIFFLFERRRHLNLSWKRR